MKKSPRPIIAHIIPFLEYCEIEKGLSDKTQATYKHFLDKFTDWLKLNEKETLKPHELTSDIIWDYRLHLARRKSPLTGRLLKKTTQKHLLVAFRNLLSYFIAKDIASLPPEKIKLPKDQSKNVKFLKLKQLEKLLLAPDISTRSGLRDRAILETLFSTGLRVSELVSLDKEQIAKTADDYLEVPITGKGNTTRTVYFSSRALEWLSKYIAGRQDTDRALFINYRGPKGAARRLTPRSIESIVKKYAKLSGLSLLATPHTIRHSYATDLMAQGVDLRLIQEFLGHKNIATTQIYTHVVNKQLKDIHRKHHSGQRMKN